MPSCSRTVSPTASAAPGASSVPEPSVSLPPKTIGTGRQYAVVAVLALVPEGRLREGAGARRRHEGAGEQQQRDYCPAHAARSA